MKTFFKKYGSFLYIGVATIAILAVVLSSSELNVVVESFMSMRVRWVWAAAAFIGLYLLARGATLMYYLRREGVRLSGLNALIVTGIGQFYSAITPSASGGQPMQVLAMHQMGVPLSTATAAVSIKFVGFQLAFILIGAVMWIFNVNTVTAQLRGIRYLVVIGYILNALLMVAVALTMVRSRVVNRVVTWLVRMLCKLHILKDEAAATERAFAILEDYRSALRRLIDSPLDALVVFVLSCVQIICLMSVTMFLFRAFELTGYGDGELFTLQLLLFITASFVPLPGAAGAQEGGFFLFFRGVFPEGDMVAAMLCWRFFTYYLLMLTGLVAVIFDAVRGHYRRRKERRNAP